MDAAERARSQQKTTSLISWSAQQVRGVTVFLAQHQSIRTGGVGPLGLPPPFLLQAPNREAFLAGLPLIGIEANGQSKAVEKGDRPPLETAGSTPWRRWLSWSPPARASPHGRWVRPPERAGRVVPSALGRIAGQGRKKTTQVPRRDYLRGRCRITGRLSSMASRVVIGRSCQTPRSHGIYEKLLSGAFARGWIRSEPPVPSDPDAGQEVSRMSLRATSLLCPGIVCLAPVSGASQNAELSASTEDFVDALNSFGLGRHRVLL